MTDKNAKIHPQPDPIPSPYPSGSESSLDACPPFLPEEREKCTGQVKSQTTLT